MNDHYTWKTARGANVTMHAKFVESENYESAEWGTVTEKVNNVVIGFVEINGKTFYDSITRIEKDGQYALDLGKQVINGKTVRASVDLPSDINAKVWGAYDAKVKADMAKLFVAPKTTNVCPNCGTYCYGDCTSN